MAIYSMGRRRVIVLLVLTSILLITLDQRGNAVIDRTPQRVLAGARAVRRRRRGPSRDQSINAWYGITNYDDLRA